MRSQSRTTLLSLLFAAATLSAQAQTLDSTNVSAVPTYEAVGLYWNSPSGATASGGCEVKFRVSGSSTWTQGLAMVYDASANQCRGSLVNLTAGTTYEAQLNLPGQAASKSITFTTWANAKPVSQTIKVASGSQTLNVSVSGTANGYVVYDGTGATLDAGNNAPYNITINASYVIVRGFTLKGAQQHGILIDKNQHDVIIEDNDISGWGRTRDGTWGTDMDSGIRAICQSEELTRVTIQRNKIHDPRYPANSWAVAHPAGPQGVTFSYCGGNNVYRWNEVYSSQNHYNDGMGGEDNFSTSGWPNKDSDVYGNKINHTWDDGLEIEGGDQNVRVWGNYVDQTGTGISSTIDSVGPLYIFRNVWDRNEFIEGAACDSDQKQPMFKDGSSSDFANGRRYLFHNTMLQRTKSGCTNGLGGGAGVGGTGDTQLVHNTVSMNNIYNLWKANGAVYQVGSDNTFQNDMFNGSMGTAVTGGINATPQYAAGNGNMAADTGLYALAAGTPGYDAAVRIPNFNDHFNGNAPDVGAMEAGDAAMKFGLAAATSTSSAGGTGTTTTTTTGSTGSTTGSTGGSTGSTGGTTGSTGGSTGSTGGTSTGTTGTAAVSAGMDASSYSLSVGASVTLTATLAGNAGTPTGNVAFKSNGTTITGCSAVALSNGKAACTTAALAGGSNAITGTYAGDSKYGAAQAGPITLTVSGSTSSAIATPTPAPATTPRKVHTDYNGDGKGDLTVVNGKTGAQGLWLMNGTGIATGVTLAPGSGYTVSMVGDFDGDGETDVLYRGADGSYKIQLMNAGAVKSEAVILQGGSGWEAVAKGDFNGDGKTDILWKSSNGTYGMWLMNGTSAMGAGLFQSPGVTWDVQLVADFGGRGKSDILWRNKDGRIQEWQMDGANSTAQVTMTSYQNPWVPLYAADFDGDGKADIVWSHPDGSIAVWLVDGTTVRSATVLAAGNTGWSVKMVGDLDGDGKADIVLQQNNGTTGAWLMNGASIKSAGSFGPAGFSPVTIDDFNNDGKADIVWRDSKGNYQVTLMNGLAATSSGSLANAGSGWEVKQNDH